MHRQLNRAPCAGASNALAVWEWVALRSPRPTLPHGLGKFLGEDELAASQWVSK